MKRITIFAILAAVMIVGGCQNQNGKQSATNTGKPNGNSPLGIDMGPVNANQNLNTNINQPASTSTPTSTMSNIDLEKITQAVIKTNLGDIQVKFYRQDSPKTVENFLKLASAGFYNGTKFHRIIKDFMIQGGDPLSKDNSLKNRWGSGGPSYTFDDEFNSHKLVAGSLAMANAGANTNGSQFFIVTAAATSWLDGKHTNFGEVVAGMDIVNKIQGLKTDSDDRPVEDVIIEQIDLK